MNEDKLKNMSFTEIIPVRVLPEHKQDINKCINQSSKYEDVSHFVRCAIIKLIRDELNENKRVL